MTNESGRPGEEATAGIDHSGNVNASPNDEDTQEFMPPSPDRSAIGGFFAYLRNEILICTIDRKGKFQSQYFGDNVDGATEYAFHRSKLGDNVYFLPNEPTGIDRRKGAIKRIRFVFVDIDPPKDGSPFDKRAAFDAVMRFDPTFIVDSGNGLHCYWRLLVPIDATPDVIELVEGMQRHLVHRFGADPAAIDVSHILRVPGTINWPNEKKAAAGRMPCPVTVALADDGKRPLPTWGALEHAFPPEHRSAAHSTPQGSAEQSVKDVAVLSSLEADDALWRLYNGDVDAYGGNHSSAELALANAVLARCGWNAEQAKRILLGAPLYQREKVFKRPDYVDRTIAKAMDGRPPHIDGPDGTAAYHRKAAGQGGSSPWGQKPAYLSGISAAALMAKEFNPIRYIVPGYIAEGLTLLAGPPKIKKSFLGLGLCVSIASGEMAFGSIPVTEGDVLYLALEDNQRRLRKRLRNMHLSNFPDRLTLVTDWPDLDNGCVQEIETWANAVPLPTLVVVDTLAKVRPRSKGNDNQYEADYRVLKDLHALASNRAISIIVIHHTRKLEAIDPFDLVSGTRGLTGAADSIMILSGSKGSSIGTLYGRGRDIEEFEASMMFEPETCRWIMRGDAAAFAKTSERQEILDVLLDASEPMTPTKVAERLGKERSNVNHLLRSLVEEGKASVAPGGLYTAVHPVHPFTAPWGNSE